MTEALIAQIVPIVEKTKERILKGIEIAQEQVPDLIEQIYAWESTISLLGIVIGAILLIIGLSCMKLVNKTAYENDWDFPYGLIYGVPMSVGSIMLIANLCKWLKIYIAPKLFLIEYISNLIK